MRFLQLIVFSFVAIFAALSPAYAQIEIDITKGNIDPTPIAVPDFLGADVQSRALGAEIAAVIRADL